MSEAPEDLLSQEEVDALLQGVANGELDLDAAQRVARGEVQPYDFTRRQRIVRGPIPTLDMINQRLVRGLRRRLFELLRREVEVEVEKAQRLEYGDLVKNLDTPCSLNQVRLHPFDGTAMVIFDAALVTALVDSYFGGGAGVAAGHARRPDREFTGAEQHVTRRLLDAVLANLADAWAPVLQVKPEFVAAESNPRFSQVLGPNEAVLGTTLRIGGAGGELHLLIPEQAIEPVREVLLGGLRGDREGQDGSWDGALRRQLGPAPVELSSVLVETELTLGQVMRLRPGDVIGVELGATVPLFAEGLQAAEGVLGQHNGRYAVKVTAGLGQGARRP